MLSKKLLKEMGCFVLFCFLSIHLFADGPVLSDGKIIEVKAKEFSIAPPIGWQIQKESWNISLLLQGPPQKREKTPHGDKTLSYQRNIQVLAFHGALDFDERTIQDFKITLAEQYSKLPFVKDFKVQSSDSVVLADGADAVLFYTDFFMAETPMMQAHLLVSSPSRHYVISFTDFAENLLGGMDSPHFKEAWDSMKSFHTELRPSSSGFYSLSAVLLGVIAALFIAGVIFNRRRKKEVFEDEMDGEGLASAREESDSGDAP
ncbi:MAG: hypothetical protein KA436_06710 [Oligoflexales bacterium]|nr:hypothetical protein [Oligoflexales bacterium]